MKNEIKNLTEAALSEYDLGFLENPNFGGWSMEKDACQFIGRICEIFRPRHVLEFGAGLSTLVLAREAAKGNVKKIWSIDHLYDFPGHPRNILTAKGQKDFVNFCYFPIKLTYITDKIFQFYSIPKDFFEKIEHLDLVIIDGPPYYYNSREPALYVVYPYLSQNSLILLDDAKRKNMEQLYIENWKYYYGENIDSVVFDNFKKGLACIWPTGHKGPVSSFAFGQRLKDSYLSLKSECFMMLRKLRNFLFRRTERCHL